MKLKRSIFKLFVLLRYTDSDYPFSIFKLFNNYVDVNIV